MPTPKTKNVKHVLVNDMVHMFIYELMKVKKNPS